MSNDFASYVSMLMFTPNMQEVVLLTKNRPQFLAGKLCPVGGHIEEGESPLEAGVREFKEETGLTTDPSIWKQFALCGGSDWEMHCFAAFHEAATIVCTQEGADAEVVCVRNVGDLLGTITRNPSYACSDLIALIGLAMQSKNRPGFAEITY